MPTQPEIVVTEEEVQEQVRVWTVELNFKYNYSIAMAFAARKHLEAMKRVEVELKDQKHYTQVFMMQVKRYQKTLQEIANMPTLHHNSGLVAADLAQKALGALKEGE